MLITGKGVMERLPWSRGVVVNFDLGKRFPGPRSQQRGSLRPRARRVVVLGVGGEICDAKSRVWGQFGPENKLIEGQPNEYDVICRNASVLACSREYRMSQ